MRVIELELLSKRVDIVEFDILGLITYGNSYS